MTSRRSRWRRCDSPCVITPCSLSHTRGPRNYRVRPPVASSHDLRFLLTVPSLWEGYKPVRLGGHRARFLLNDVADDFIDEAKKQSVRCREVVT